MFRNRFANMFIISAVQTLCTILAVHSGPDFLPLPYDMLRFESTQDMLFQKALEAFSNSSACQNLGLNFEIKDLDSNRKILAMQFSQMSYLASKRSGVGPALFAAEMLKINASSMHIEVEPAAILHIRNYRRVIIEYVSGWIQRSI
jgi:hypothetical protein